MADPHGYTLFFQIIACAVVCLGIAGMAIDYQATREEKDAVSRETAPPADRD